MKTPKPKLNQFLNQPFGPKFADTIDDTEITIRSAGSVFGKKESGKPQSETKLCAVARKSKPTEIYIISQKDAKSLLTDTVYVKVFPAKKKESQPLSP